MPGNRDPELDELARAPTTELYIIDVSFPMLKDQAEAGYLNGLPTSFVLPPEAVDRPGAVAGKIILSSPEFQRLLGGAGATLAVDPAFAAGSATVQ